MLVLERKFPAQAIETVANSRIIKMLAGMQKHYKLSPTIISTDHFLKLSIVLPDLPKLLSRRVFASYSKERGVLSL